MDFKYLPSQQGRTSFASPSPREAKPRCRSTSLGQNDAETTWRWDAVAWMGSMPNRMEIARRVSPLTYVRADLPPILTIHGDADPTVPYTHAQRLHKALTEAGVDNKLLTIPGGKHGNFKPEERTRIYETIREFLNKHGLKPSAGV